MKIPGTDSFGGRPSLQSNKRIVDDKSAVIVADAATDFGEAAIRTGTAVKDSRDRFAYQMAKSRLLQADMEIKRKVQENPDFKNWEGEYRDQFGLAREEIVGTLDNPQDRAMLDQESSVMTESGGGTMYGQAFKREVDQGVADLNSALVASKEGYLEAKTPEQRASYMKHVNTLITLANENQFINDEQTQFYRESATKEFAEDFVTMLSDEDQIVMLSSPEGTQADFITKDRRKELLDAAIARGKEEKMARIAQAAADGAWEPGISLDSFLKASTKGQTGLQRERTENRAISVYNRNDVARQEKFQSVWDLMSNSGKDMDGNRQYTIDDVMRDMDVVDLLDAKDQEALRKLDERLEAGTPPKHDDATWVMLVRKATRQPENLARENPMWYRDRLDDSHFDQLVAMQAGLKTGDNSISIDTLTYMTKITDAAGGAEKRQSVEGQELVRRMDAWMAKESADGVVPNTDEVNKQLAIETTDVFVYEGGMDLGPLGKWFGDEKNYRAYEVLPEDDYLLKFDKLSKPERDQIIKEIEMETGEPFDHTDDNARELVEDAYWDRHLKQRPVLNKRYERRGDE